MLSDRSRPPAGDSTTLILPAAPAYSIFAIVMAHRAAAPTRVTVARIERVGKPSSARAWRPRSLLDPLFKREPFDLFAALTAHLVEPDSDESSPGAFHGRARPSPVDVGPPSDPPPGPVDEPLLERLALPGGFRFDPARDGEACFVPCGA